MARPSPPTLCFARPAPSRNRPSESRWRKKGLRRSCQATHSPRNRTTSSHSAASLDRSKESLEPEDQPQIGLALVRIIVHRHVEALAKEIANRSRRRGGARRRIAHVEPSTPVLREEIFHAAAEAVGEAIAKARWEVCAVMGEAQPKRHEWHELSLGIAQRNVNPPLIHVEVRIAHRRRNACREIDTRQLCRLAIPHEFRLDIGKYRHIAHDAVVEAALDVQLRERAGVQVDGSSETRASERCNFECPRRFAVAKLGIRSRYSAGQ